MSAQVIDLPQRGEASTNAAGKAGSQSTVLPFVGRDSRLAAIHTARRTHPSHIVRDSAYVGYSHPFGNIAAVNIIVRMLVDQPVEAIASAAFDLPNEQFDVFVNGLADLVDILLGDDDE